jgi:hypothetical protein
MSPPRDLNLEMLEKISELGIPGLNRHIREIGACFAAMRCCEDWESSLESGDAADRRRRCQIFINKN